MLWQQHYGDGAALRFGYVQDVRAGSRSMIRRFFRRGGQMMQRKQVYCVMYLNARGSVERMGIEEELQRSADYCRLFESTWLVATPETADTLYARLIGCFSGDDQVVILEVGEQACSWLPRYPEASRWLQRYV